MLYAKTLYYYLVNVKLTYGIKNIVNVEAIVSYMKEHLSYDVKTYFSKI